MKKLMKIDFLYKIQLFNTVDMSVIFVISENFPKEAIELLTTGHFPV